MRNKKCPVLVLFHQLSFQLMKDMDETITALFHGPQKKTSEK